MNDGTVSTERRAYLIDQALAEHADAWRRLASGEKASGDDTMTIDYEINELRRVWRRNDARRRLGRFAAVLLSLLLVLVLVCLLWARCL